MKNDPEITPLLEKIQKAVRRSTRAAKDISEAQSDLAQLQQSITDLGEPSYKDDAKISLLAASRNKLELCAKAIDRLQDKLDGYAEENAVLLVEGSNLAQRAVHPLLDARRETIVCAIRPFCGSDHEAVYLAQQTSAYRSAYSTIAAFSTSASQARFAGAQTIFECLVKVSAVLEEAAKGDRGDLMRFLVESPAAPLAAAQSETPAVVAGDQGGAK